MLDKDEPSEAKLVSKPRKPRTFPVVIDSTGREGGDNKGILRNVSGPTIKSRRLQLGWTQQRLADEVAHVSRGEWTPTQPDIRRVEGQRRILADRDLLYTATALSCTASWLLGERDAPEPNLPVDSDESR